jgi:hypothetical protein
MISSLSPELMQRRPGRSAGGSAVIRRFFEEDGVRISTPGAIGAGGPWNSGGGGVHPMRDKGVRLGPGVGPGRMFLGIEEDGDCHDVVSSKRGAAPGHYLVDGVVIGNCYRLIQRQPEEAEIERHTIIIHIARSWFDNVQAEKTPILVTGSQWAVALAPRECDPSYVHDRRRDLGCNVEDGSVQE